MPRPPGQPPRSPSPQQAPWAEKLRRHFGRGWVIVGIGNRMRGDDAAGSLVAEGLSEAGLPRVIDCQEAPENFLGKIRDLQPDGLLIVDAVEFGGDPGEVRLFDAAQFQTQAVSTHAAGITPLGQYLGAGSEIPCRILAVQPADVSWGAEVSEPVRRAVQRTISHPVWREQEN